MPDAGTQLRKALGLPEPDYGPNYRNPAYFGGYRSAEDERDFAEMNARFDAYEREVAEREAEAKALAELMQKAAA